MAKAVTEGDLVAAAVLSGNRNFEGRINPLVKANYLASPPLVVAYALAGTTDIDLTTEPLGTGSDGKPVYPEGHLADARGSRQTVVDSACSPRCSSKRYANVCDSQPEVERHHDAARATCIDWDAESTYIQEPPFLVDLPPSPAPIQPIRGAPVSGGAGRLGDDRPHLAGRLDRGKQPGRQVPASSTASSRSISTATARAAATIA